jgi:hypothetical protein
MDEVERMIVRRIAKQMKERQRGRRHGANIGQWTALENAAAARVPRCMTPIRRVCEDPELG